MGYTTYSADFTTSYVRARSLAGVDTFEHTRAINAGEVARAVHESLNPAKKNAAGVIIRESLDSAEHPNSRAVAILFDVTGSMEQCPRIFLEKLPNLMSLLVRKGILQDPQILFGAIGDHEYDKGPLQVGQFESGNEMDGCLTNAWLEKGGGWPKPEESYELGMYFLAQYAKMDCLDKRGEKGFCFILGDERPHPTVSAEALERLTGERPQSDIPTEEVLERLREKFHVFWIMPGGTLHEKDAKVVEPLKEMFGQQFIRLKKPEDVCELIATAIGITEGRDVTELAEALGDVGANKGSVASAINALSEYRPAPAPHSEESEGEVDATDGALPQ